MDGNNRLCTIVLKFSASGYATSNIIDFMLHKYNDKFESVDFTLRRGNQNSYSRLYFEKAYNGNAENVLDSESSGTEENADILLKLSNNTLENKKNADIIEVSNWFLKSVCLSDNAKYFKLFIENGYETLKLIKSYINEDRLKQIGITKQGHILRILDGVKKIKADVTNIHK
eukprot:54424_1